MSDILVYLRNRLEIAKQRIQQVNDKIQQLQNEHQTLVADIQGYERTIGAELRASGGIEPLEVVAPDPEELALILQGGERSETNKAEFARLFIRTRSATGVTPADILHGFQEAKIPITKPYVYSLVQRLKKQEDIRQRRGRWFPVVDLDQVRPNDGAGAV